jgi:arsenate reductase (thioredoxin)
VPDIHNVLFLCSGNSARSIMAEAILNMGGAGTFRAFSAGTDPHGEIHPHALAVLRSAGYDTSLLRPKSWIDFARPEAPDLHFVFTVCDDAAGESCPVWPGQPITAHWGIPDPCAATGSEAEIAVAFDDTYGMLRRRIDLFLALPIVKLDRLVLVSHLKEIGRAEGATKLAKTG